MAEVAEEAFEVKYESVLADPEMVEAVALLRKNFPEEAPFALGEE